MSDVINDDLINVDRLSEFKEYIEDEIAVKTEINDAAASASTTYSSNKIIELDDNILAQIAEPYDSTKTYYEGDTFIKDGQIYYVASETLTPQDNIYHRTDLVTLTKDYRPCFIKSEEQINTTSVLPNGFVFIHEEDDEKIWENAVYIYHLSFDATTSKYSLNTNRIAEDDTATVTYGVILAKNDLTGIETIEDAERLLKLQKVDNEYVVTYSNSVKTATSSVGRNRYQKSNVSKGTSPIAYIRSYAIFPNGDGTDTVLYTPVIKLTWEEE